MTSNRLVTFLAAGFLSCASAHALTIDTVPVPIANNIYMGKTEVTNAQYVEFLNAVAATDPLGLYDPGMESSTLGGVVRNSSPGSFTYSVKPPALDGAYLYDNKPVVFVSWFSAARFANWLHNGQGGPGTTEIGAYTLLGGTRIPSNANNIRRNPGARWWIPSGLVGVGPFDWSWGEWPKAAYHDPNLNVYYDYPTGTDIVPNNNPPSLDTGNSANYFDNDYATGNASFPLTDVGAYTQSGSPYGTFDQGGNVAEWLEYVHNRMLVNQPPFCIPGTICFPRPPIYVDRYDPGYTGSSWNSDASNLNSFAVHFIGSGAATSGTIGFRLATSVPEPASVTSCLSIVLIALVLSRRKEQRQRASSHQLTQNRLKQWKRHVSLRNAGVQFFPQPFDGPRPELACGFWG